MAKVSKIIKALRPPKYRTQQRHRRTPGGRPRAYMRQCGTCRIRFRQLASECEVPGSLQATW